MTSGRMRIAAWGPYVVRQVTRHRTRSLLTIAGIAIAMFLLTTVRAMQSGVAEATRVSAADTTLVVYRKDRFCPATSILPQDYDRRIAQMEGVVSVLPMKIVVSNCRTSLDVVIFRGVPRAAFLADRGESIKLISGSFEDWQRRSDAVLVGETLAQRRGLQPGMTFDAAGITVYVAGVFRSDNPQDQNAAYASLDYVQTASRSGLGEVTQLNVKVADASLLEPLAEAIDETFRTAQAPTTTMSEKAYVGRIASDVIELVGFAGWLGLGCLAAMLALIGNSIVLSVQSRIAEHAVLQTLGCPPGLIALLIVAEGVLLAIAGGAAGAAAAIAVIRGGSFALSVEGQTIPIAADMGLLAGGLTICLAIGLTAGLFPAWQASRRSIASCFRSV
ncbi:MAG: ABC transporter permease [Phycisphaeraceae bacterium]|nr:ABC transporter permease [Phycisphaeraceae bacterium]